jgi:hypothetical protein
MDHQSAKNYHLPNRFGFYYFPDYLHYAGKDIHCWLPVLKEINAQWLVIPSPANRAIPEDFIRELSASGINLVVDFNFPLSAEIEWHDLELLISSYGKWGAKYSILNQHPNQQMSWDKSQWGNPDLINSVVSQFIQFGRICLENGIRPIFPLLTPGGDYWDLAFLKIALSQLKNDAPMVVKNNFILSAAAWDWGKPLDWGTGGKESWPNVKPYKLPKESQNQLGFRTYEWYLPIAREVFGKTIPTLLLQAGVANNPRDPESKIQSTEINNLLAINRLLKGENVYDELDESHLFLPISSDVIGCCFYLLSSDSPNPLPCQWYTSEGLRLPPAQALVISDQRNQEKNVLTEPEPSQTQANFQYNRYILIDQGLRPETPKLLELLHPYIEKFRPMIGFSVEEAKKSAFILIISSANGSEPPDFEFIKSNGSIVKMLRPGEIPTYIKEQDYAKQ